MVRARVVAAVLGVISLTTAACGTSGATRDAVVAPQPPERLRAQVLEALPHDPTAFTEGLEIAHGTLYESTGLLRRSTVSAIDMDNGKVKAARLPAKDFGEGLTVTDSAMWQLTWRNHIAYERDPKTLKVRKTAKFSGEGWGICDQSDPDRLVMSNGSDTLTFRDPETFKPTGTVHVTSAGEPVENINELECVDNIVYANIWQTNTIVRIDVASGKVTGKIDASGLLTPAEAKHADVLNGIAAVPGSDAFFITGKLWPKLFRVRFVPA